MATAIDAELQLPQQVKDFNVDTFLKSLGYSIQQLANEDVIARPPANGNTPAGGRRMLQSDSRGRLLALPPRRRQRLQQPTL
jgi:hypothetical protein